MKEIDRESLLDSLKAVQPGLYSTSSETFNFFIFNEKSVFTYNGEALFSHPCVIGEVFQGKIRGEPLLNMVRKLKEETISIGVSNENLVLVGKRRKAGFVAEKGRFIEEVDTTKNKWVNLPDCFGEMLSLVEKCTSNEIFLLLGCMHFHPEWLEACNNYQLCRWKIKLGIENESLVSGKFVGSVTKATEIADGKNWLHFKLGSLCISLRKHKQKFPHLDNYLNPKDTKEIRFPKILVKALERAKILLISSEDKVRVTISPKKVLIKSVGVDGWYEEEKKVTDYTGESFSFLVSAKVLQEIIKGYDHCMISRKFIKVEKGPFTYISSLFKEGSEV